MTTIAINSMLSRNQAVGQVSSIPLDGGYEVCVRKSSRNRSTKQNNLYWQWMSIIASETGDSVDDLHDYFKRKFLGLQARQVLDDVVITVKDSHSLSTKEFAEYMTQVQCFALQELNIELPSA